MLRPASGDLDMTVEVRYVPRSLLWDEIWRRLLMPPPKARPTQGERHPFPAKVEDDAQRPATNSPGSHSIRRRRVRAKAAHS